MPTSGSQVTLCDLPIRFDTYEGCTHACSYCFVKRNSNIADVKLGETIKSLENFIKGKRSATTRWCDWAIPLHWGGMSDPFQPAEKLHRRSLEALRVFAQTKYPFVVSTKATLLAEEPYYSLLKECNCVVQFSAVNSKYDRLEPGAATYEERIKAAEKIAKICRVNLRIQPYHPGLFKDIIKAIPRYAEIGVHGVTLEAMKYTRANVPGLVSKGPDLCYPVEILLPQYESIKRACHKYGLKFYCGENRLRALSDELCCCGIEGMGWRENKANLNHFLFDRDNFLYTGKMKEVGTAEPWKAKHQTTIGMKLINGSSYASMMEKDTANCYEFREADGPGFNEEQSARLRAYLREALKRSGKTQADVAKHLGNFMARHYFSTSQWDFPTKEAYDKLREILPLGRYEEVIEKIGGKSMAHNGKIYGVNK